jgi:predicted aminopeptidase
MLEHKRGEWRAPALPIPAFPAEPNNAFLVSIALYTELVPAFEASARGSGGDLEELLRRCAALADKRVEREACR